MALTAGQITASARFYHPAFTPAVIPFSVATEFGNRAQRYLMREIHKRDPSYLVRVWAIRLLPDQNVATVGVGTTGEAPLIDGTTSLARRTVNTGAVAELDETTSILQDETPVTGAGPTSLTDAAASWTVDEYAGDIVQIVAGTGAGQVRVVESNTADTLTIPSTQPWTTVPDGTSTYLIRVQETEVPGDLSVQMARVPATAVRQGWLVRLDAAGVPYLDLDSPVSVSYETGIPLPPNDFTDHGAAVLNDPVSTRVQVTKIPPSARWSPPRGYAYWVQGQQLFLSAPYSQWQGVASLEIPYLPIPPKIANDESFLLLPDASEEAMVALVALDMVDRAITLNAATEQTLGTIREKCAAQIASYLSTFDLGARGMVDSIMDVGDGDFGPGWRRYEQ
jgi:hypothetical protein